jgi:hypothetical protein
VNQKEIAMAQSKQLKNLGKATNHSGNLKASSGSGRWVRVAIMCLSGGFIFPHALTENDVYEANASPSRTEGKKN